MQILIDTNVILDVLLNRESFAQDAVKLLKLPASDVQNMFLHLLLQIYIILRVKKSEISNW